MGKVHTLALIGMLAVGVFSPRADAEVFQGFTTLKSSQEMTIDLSLNSQTQKADIILTGLDHEWFSVGFGTTVDNGAYVIVVEGGGLVQERKLGNHSAGSSLADTVVEISNTASNGIRTVVLQRDLDVGDSDYYAFNAAPQTLDLIWAHGNGASFSFHDDRGSTSITLAAVPEPATGAGIIVAMVLLLAGRSRRESSTRPITASPVPWTRRLQDN